MSAATDDLAGALRWLTGLLGELNTPYQIVGGTRKKKKLECGRIPWGTYHAVKFYVWLLC